MDRKNLFFFIPRPEKFDIKIRINEKEDYSIFEDMLHTNMLVLGYERSEGRVSEPYLIHTYKRRKLNDD